MDTPIDDLFYPIIYHNNGYTSDKDFIMKMMKFIPEDQRVRISNEYMVIYCQFDVPDRKGANTFLHDQAKKYREASLVK